MVGDNPTRSAMCVLQVFRDHVFVGGRCLVAIDLDFDWVDFRCVVLPLCYLS